jgi:hypothetical protein
MSGNVREFEELGDNGWSYAQGLNPSDRLLLSQFHAMFLR